MGQGGGQGGLPGGASVVMEVCSVGGALLHQVTCLTVNNIPTFQLKQN